MSGYLRSSKAIAKSKISPANPPIARDSKPATGVMVSLEMIATSVIIAAIIIRTFDKFFITHLLLYKAEVFRA